MMERELEELYRRRILAGSGETEIRDKASFRKIRTARYDVYLPASASSSSLHPIVFLVHGEAPFESMKDAGQFVSWGECLAARGFAAVAFDHRMLTHGNAEEDVVGDIDFVLGEVAGRADEYGIDRTRVCVWSFSAGMPAGIASAFSGRTEGLRCFIGYYGVGSFSSLRSLASLPARAGVRDTAAIITAAGESARARSVGLPSLFFARAGLDNPSLNASLDSFVASCLSQNFRVEMHNHESGRHAFDILDDNDRTRDVLDATLRFLGRELG